MTTQPYCLCCGKKIAKYTTPIWFNKDENPPRTLDEAKARTNMQVVSHSWWGDAPSRYIVNISVWDGDPWWQSRPSSPADHSGALPSDLSVRSVRG